MTLTPYIMFNGTCEEALNFYAKALNGKITDLNRFEGSPAEGMSNDGQKVMHAIFAAGDFQLMAADGSESEAVGGMVHLSTQRRRARNHAAAGHVLGRYIWHAY